MPKPCSSPEGTPKLTEYQTFAFKRVLRSQLRTASYNPRQIDKFARAKLVSKLRSRGLLEAVIWNEATGMVVGGHQRLAALDELHKGAEYELDVAAVSLTPIQERETNVFLNNLQCQGEFDPDKLADVLRSEGFDWQQSGMDSMDVDMVLNQGSFQETAQDADVMRELQAIGAFKDPPRHSMDDPKPEGDRTSLAHARESIPKMQEAMDSEVYAVVRFNTIEQKRRALIAMGIPSNSRYIRGDQVQGLPRYQAP